MTRHYFGKSKYDGWGFWETKRD
uniref:Uncharacterized protein n=1 Tax=Anguilla anguilla TaxID=7936 RepID=A0A0E9XBS2_ANGAN